MDLESDKDLDQEKETINLHINFQNNEKQIISKISPHSIHFSHSVHHKDIQTPFIMSKLDISMEAISSNSLSERESDKLIDISSGSLSDTESEKLQNDIRDNRRAETILRKNIINLKDVIRDLIDTVPHEMQNLLEELETRVGHGDKAGDIATKLEKLSEKLVGTIKARDEAFNELQEVRQEGIQARKSLNEYHNK